MSWMNEFETSKSKKEYIGKKVALTTTTPTPIGKGMFEVILKDLETQKCICMILTRRDITTILDAKAQNGFTFVTDPKNPEWANVKV